MNIIRPNVEALALGFTAQRVSWWRWSYRHPLLPEAIARYAATVQAYRVEVAAYAVAYWRQHHSAPTFNGLIANLAAVLPATHLEVWEGSLAAEYAALTPFVELAWQMAESPAANEGDEINSARQDGVLSINSGVAA